MTIEEFISSIIAVKTAKAAVAIIGTYLLQFLIPIAPFLTMTIILVVADTITGIRAAQKREEVINSKGFRKTIEKLFYYLLLIMLAHAMQLVYLPSLPLVYMVSFYVSMTEFQSNIENISTITGKNIWSFLLKWIFSKIKMK